MRALVHVGFVALAIAAACSRPEPRDASEAEYAGFPDSCNAIDRACHDVDRGEGLPHRCHLMGHSVQVIAQDCDTARDECVRACDRARANEGGQ